MEVAAFIATYWWVWPLMTIGSGIFAFRSLLGFGSDSHSMKKMFLVMILLWVCGILSVTSFILNLIAYAKHI